MMKIHHAKINQRKCDYHINFRMSRLHAKKVIRDKGMDYTMIEG
jgi:hypothetical protein